MELRGEARQQHVDALEAAKAPGRVVLGEPGVVRQVTHDEVGLRVIDGHLVFFHEGEIWRIINRDSFSQVTVEHHWQPRD